MARRPPFLPQDALRARLGRPWEAEDEAPDAPRILDTSYARLVSDAGAAALGLAAAIESADPRDVPAVLLAELPGLETAAQRLEAAGCPPAAREAHERLVRGLRQLREDLMAVSEEASLEASQGDVFQAGLFLSSITGTGGGGRMRWELSQSHGADDVRTALTELKAAGFTADGFA